MRKGAKMFRMGEAYEEIYGIPYKGPSTISKILGGFSDDIKTIRDLGRNDAASRKDVLMLSYAVCLMLYSILTPPRARKLPRRLEKVFLGYAFWL